MNRPLISVVIPTCNRIDLLARCLDRLEPGVQTLSEEAYEVIVTDDGIDDRTISMLCDQYAWVRRTKGPHKGPAANRNHGTRLAHGEWIAFTDDDCLPDINWLSSYREAIQPGFLAYEGKTVCLSKIVTPLGECPVNLTGGYLWSCNMMLRRCIFEELGGFDERFPHAANEDVDLRDRLEKAGHNFLFVDVAVVNHPMRRVVWGRRTAERWKGSVLLWYKRGNRSSATVWLPFYMLNYRVRQILRAPLCPDSILAIFGMCVELCCVLPMLRVWDRQYRTMCGLNGGSRC